MSALLASPQAAVDIDGSLSRATDTVATFVPRFLGFLAIVLIGYFVAKAVATVLDKVLERVGFDRAVERGGIRNALARSQYDASDIVSKIAFYFIFVAALSMAFGVLGIAALAVPMAALLALLPKILVALVIVVIGCALAAGAKSFISNVLGGLSYGNALGTAASVLIVLLFAKAALDEVGIATTVTGPILYAILGTVAGIAIVGVGGGLIKPMQARWEDMLNKASEETQNVKAELRGDADPYPADGGPVVPAVPAATTRPPRTATYGTPRRTR